MKTVRLLQILGLALAAAVIPACLSSNPDRSAPQPPPPGGPTEVLKAAMLSGRQEVPPVVTTASGNATVTIDSTRTTIDVTVEFSGLSNITEAHLHVGRPGIDGPIIFPLAAGSFTSPLVVTLTSASLVPAVPQGISTFDQAVDAILNGNTYVNIHTTLNPDGEIRGQVGPVDLFATLTGGQEAPPVLTFATGTLTLSLNKDQTEMILVLNETGIVNVTAAHIHVAPPGVDGPIIFPIAENFYQVPLTMTSFTFTPQPGAGILTFEEAIDAIISGGTYVNVHTTDNPDGEIRGQILP